MRILCVGDVVGKVGCNHLRKVLPKIKKQYEVDVCIVNGENSADGNGMHPASINSILDSGADMITGGNHSFRRKEVCEELDTNPFVLRPLNFPDSCPGVGVGTVDRGRFQVTVISVLGQAYMEPLGSPFSLVDKALKEAGNPKFCIVDIHAEASSEKKCLGYYLDGRVSAVFGTHTHVQTADEQILPKGTGFITDVGMTGPKESVLGIRPLEPIEKFRTGMPVKFVVEDVPCQMDAVLFTLDDQTGKTVSVERIQVM